MVWKNYMIVLGGCDGKHLFSDIHFLDTSTLLLVALWTAVADSFPDTMTWSQPQTTGWITPRSSFGAAITDNRLFVFGGQSAQGPLNDLCYLDLSTAALPPE